MNTVEICGYGIGIAPIPPFQIGRMGDKGPTPDSLILAHQSSDRLRNLMIRPGRGSAPNAKFAKVWQGEPASGFWLYQKDKDGTAVALGAGMKDISEVANWSAESPDTSWSIQTDTYRVSWPNGFRLFSTDTNSRWPFELHGDEGAMIFMRGPLSGPEQIPAPQQMVGPGQKLVDQGNVGSTIWIEVEYEHEAKTWRQRHYYGVLDEKRVVLVTAQALKSHAGELARACDLIAKSLKRR